ncbi:MAG: hypothetical protein QXE50_05985 [Nitrososphaerota archaeon]
MATYQTTSKVSIIGTVPSEIRGGTVTSTILGTVTVTGPFLGTVGIVGTIATILSPIIAETTPPKRGTVSAQLIATLTPTAVSTLLTPNTNRALFYIRLLDTGTVYIGYMGTVSSATFTALLMDYEVYSDDVYTGVVTGRSEGANVRVVVYEL